MAPKGHTRWCQASLREDFGHCHRYDQSAINALLGDQTTFPNVSVHTTHFEVPSPSRCHC